MESRIIVIMLALLWVCSGCNHTGDSHTATEQSPISNTVVVELHDTVHVSVTDTVKVQDFSDYIWAGELDISYVNALFKGYSKGNVKSYETLCSYFTNRSLPLPTMLFSVNMAHYRKYIKAYYNCFNSLCFPYRYLKQQGISKLMDDETKMLALYFLSKGAKLGSEECRAVLNTCQDSTADKKSEEYQVSEFYYQNGNKDVDFKMCSVGINQKQSKLIGKSL